MACETPMSDIMRFADAELPPDRAAAIEQHLATCGDCSAAFAQALSLKRAVRVAGQRYVPSAELRERVRSQIAPQRRRMTWVPVLAFAALLVVASVVALRVITAKAASQQLMAEVVDRHVTALASANPVDVVSTDRHTVKPWFQGKLPFTFNLPELAGTPYTLVGGRITFLNDEPGAQLIYDLRKHHISVFIFQDRIDLPFATSRRSSFTIETWVSGGLRYFVVTDASNEDVKPLVDMLKTASRLGP